jgi:hypothetical protein
MNYQILKTASEFEKEEHPDKQRLSWILKHDLLIAFMDNCAKKGVCGLNFVGINKRSSSCISIEWSIGGPEWETFRTDLMKATEFIDPDLTICIVEIIQPKESNRMTLVKNKHHKVRIGLEYDVAR